MPGNRIRHKAIRTGKYYEGYSSLVNEAVKIVRKNKKTGERLAPAASSYESYMRRNQPLEAFFSFFSARFSFKDLVGFFFSSFFSLSIDFPMANKI